LQIISNAIIIVIKDKKVTRTGGEKKEISQAQIEKICFLADY
jgi:hypothetical protein